MKVAARLLRGTAVIGLVLLAAASAWGGEPAGVPGAEVPVGGRLHEVALTGLNGPDRSLSAFFGRPLIINVWASWCGPCRQEMQSLERLAWRSDHPYFSIIGISTDDYPAKALGLLAGSNATISQFIDVRLQMETMLGANRLPLTVLVGPGGRVLRKIYGSREWDGDDAARLIDETFHGPAARFRNSPSAARPSSRSGNGVSSGS
jgi:thiol-disulfide isomerase/thioredoxin